VANRWSEAFKHLQTAYLLFHSLEEPNDRLVPVLKRTVAAQMLAGLKSVFYVRAFSSLADHKEIKPLTDLTKAFESNVSHVYNKAVKALRPVLKADPVVGPYAELILALEPKIDYTDAVAVLYRRVDPKEAEGMECSICLDPFGDPFDPKQQGQDEGGYARAVRLFRCAGHYFHQHCVKPWIEKAQNCPVCDMYYGQGIGDMPEGKMDVTRETGSLPGFNNAGTLVMKFTFPAGTHGPDNTAYSASTINAYLPNNPEGQKVLELFEKAWERKQLWRVDENGEIADNGFTIKTIKTSGVKGFPDATYLERVTQEFQSRDIR